MDRASSPRNERSPPSSSPSVHLETEKRLKVEQDALPTTLDRPSPSSARLATPPLSQQPSANSQAGSPTSLSRLSGSTLPPNLSKIQDSASGRIVCDACGAGVSIRDEETGRFTGFYWEEHHRQCQAPTSKASHDVFRPSQFSYGEPVGHNSVKRRRAKRTEEERISYLKSDPYVSKFEAYRVLCRICEKWIRLRPNSTYCSIPWDAHRKSCLARRGAQTAFMHSVYGPGAARTSSGYSYSELQDILSSDKEVRKFDLERILCRRCDVWIQIYPHDHLASIQLWLQHRAECVEKRRLSEDIEGQHSRHDPMSSSSSVQSMAGRLPDYPRVQVPAKHPSSLRSPRPIAPMPNRSQHGKHLSASRPGRSISRSPPPNRLRDSTSPPRGCRPQSASSSERFRSLSPDAQRYHYPNGHFNGGLPSAPPPLAAAYISSGYRPPPPGLPMPDSRRRNAEQRAASLRADTLIDVVEPNRVFCSLCEKWVQLRQDSTYCAYPWIQHRSKCLARHERRAQRSEKYDNEVEPILRSPLTTKQPIPPYPPRQNSHPAIADRRTSRPPLLHAQSSYAHYERESLKRSCYESDEREYKRPRRYYERSPECEDLERRRNSISLEQTRIALERVRDYQLDRERRHRTSQSAPQGQHHNPGVVPNNLPNGPVAGSQDAQASPPPPPPPPQQNATTSPRFAPNVHDEANNEPTVREDTATTLNENGNEDLSGDGRKSQDHDVDVDSVSASSSLEQDSIMTRHRHMGRARDVSPTRVDRLSSSPRSGFLGAKSLRNCPRLEHSRFSSPGQRSGSHSPQATSPLLRERPNRLADLDSESGRQSFIYNSIRHLFSTTYEMMDDLTTRALLDYVIAAMPPDKFEDFDLHEIVRALRCLEKQGKIAVNDDIVKMVQ